MPKVLWWKEKNPAVLYTNIARCKQRKVKCDGQQPCSSCQSFKRISKDTTPICIYDYNPKEIAMETVLVDTVIDQSIEQHLIELSFLYHQGYSVNEKFQSVHSMLRHNLSPLLRKALCFNSCFYSNHPLLFPANPTFQQRLKIANRFCIDSKMIRPLSSYITNQELCDDLHALLHQSIGNIL